jgi:hypothetical protein
MTYTYQGVSWYVLLGWLGQFTLRFPQTAYIAMVVGDMKVQISSALFGVSFLFMIVRLEHGDHWMLLEYCTN